MNPRRARLLLAPVLAALLAAPAGAGVPGTMEAATSAAPVRTQPLAAGEVLIEAGGVGIVTTRADLATITVTIFSSGGSLAEARRVNRAEAGRVVDAARRAGIPADAIELQTGNPNSSVRVVDVAEAPPPIEEPPQGQPGLESPAHHASSTVVIRSRDIDKAPEVRAMLQAAGANDVSAPLYSLTNMSPVRHRAQAQALIAARADAEAHAAQRNMRVVRLVRVTERIGTDIFALAFNNAAQVRSVNGAQNPSQPQPRPDIVTVLLLGADFALAPR